MIAIDTNVLLRYLLEDDEAQFEKANALIRGQHPVLITDIVLAETIWALRGKRYNLNKKALCTVIRELIGDAAFVFENNQVIWSSLRDYEESKRIDGKNLDFADSLIFNKSYLVAKNKGIKLSGFYSFDKAVKQLKGAKKP